MAKCYARHAPQILMTAQLCAKRKPTTNANRATAPARGLASAKGLPRPATGALVLVGPALRAVVLVPRVAEVSVALVENTWLLMLEPSDESPLLALDSIDETPLLTFERMLELIDESPLLALDSMDEMPLLTFERMDESRLLKGLSRGTI
jgi:hypothetical protein